MGNCISKTVIRQCLDLLDVPKGICEFLDYRSQKLTVHAAIQLFVEAQLSQRSSPAEIQEHLRAEEELRVVTGLTSVSGSQFSRKLNQIPTFLLQYLFQQVNQRIQLALQETRAGVSGKEMVKLSVVDSTTISLPDFHGKWAYCSKTQNSVKMHTRFCTELPDLSYPDKVILSTGAVSDSEMTIELVTEKGTTYVMDRGYINYAHFKKWAEAGILFVARIQARSKTKLLEQRPTPQDDPLLQLDADVELSIPARPDENVKLRLIEFKDDKGRTYRIVTNRWDLTARGIADIYRDRWMIELFFKWMKQHLCLTKLYSYKPDAVWNQIYLALIAYGLCVLVKLQTETEKSTWDVLLLIRMYMLKSWEQFLAALRRKPTRTSRGRQKKAKRGRPRVHPEKRTAKKVVVESL